MTRYGIEYALGECECCHLVDTTVMVRDKRRCSLCREFCAVNWACAVRHWLEDGPAGRDQMQDALRSVLREDKPHL